MPREVIMPVQSFKNSLAGIRGAKNGLQHRAYWSHVSEAALEASLLTGSTEVVLEVDVDEYGEPGPGGEPIELTHRFSGGLLAQLGVSPKFLMRATRGLNSLDIRTTEALSHVVEKGLNIGEQCVAAATLQAVARSTAERKPDLTACQKELVGQARRLHSRSQLLLASPDGVDAPAITEILHERNALAARQASLDKYGHRVRTRFERATKRVQGGTLPEVVGVAAMVSGLKQAGKDVDVETEGTTVIDAMILKLADRIAFK